MWKKSERPCSDNKSPTGCTTCRRLVIMLSGRSRSADGRRHISLPALSRAEVPADRRIVDAQVATDLHERVTKMDGCCDAQWELRALTSDIGSEDLCQGCLLYTSDAADDLLCVDLG